MMDLNSFHDLIFLDLRGLVPFAEHRPSGAIRDGGHDFDFVVFQLGEMSHSLLDKDAMISVQMIGK